jgi:hypothetical protein
VSINQHVRVISATGGFKGSLWLVQTPDQQQHVVNALSNYEAAEACGHNFRQCYVQRVFLTAEPQ